ncbi:tRNA1(Val) (adenine(37)-N6)-methyltransferase [Candidatus Epulonipiscium viviparus]|uniref:tRNA1(Val) (adenine(37)-N6)-methyltransferase n=1 Tax=Candidatus Epulonipiscium viviparus TaxID=420336 RepID=UPI002738070B|nr:tRNA1(Val) (adenine(37)-N6)-methyltransferase [Candidatus Epulopiscium viviparus]
MIKINDYERVDDIQREGYKLIQNPKAFCFGIDAVLLAHFVSGIKIDSKILDIGTGTGIIPLILYAIHKKGKFVGIDIQEAMVEMASRTMMLNQVSNEIEIKCLDIKNFGQDFKRGSFDIIVSNPPYMKAATGLKNSSATKTIARHEVACDLEDIIKASNFILKERGQLFLIHRANRLVDILNLLRQNKIEPKQLRMIYPKITKPPTMVLIHAVKGGGLDLRIEKPLIVYNEDNTYTQEIYDIYEKKML